MRRPPAALAAATLLCVAAAGGCGVGPGESSKGTATLRVTEDFGAETIAEGTLENPTQSDTVVRFLDDVADIETSYGGNFVDSIDGLEGSASGGGQRDWFFFVNGYYSDIGAGEAEVRPGDRIWWDFRDWQEAYRVPAVVGSWPAPFAGRPPGEQPRVVVECVATADACDETVGRMREAGIDPRVETVPAPREHPDELRVLVGSWNRLRSDPAARQLEAGPSTSGVYARLEPCAGGWSLTVLGSDAQPRLRLPEAGLVAAVRQAQDEPTWLVAGTDEAGVDEAAALLDAETLRDRYAMAAGPGGEAQAVPAAADLPPVSDPGACG